MREIRLNGAKMRDKPGTHAYLKRKLALPEYYGENLDALWDCLASDFSGMKIIIGHPAAIISNLGSYGESILKLFQDLARENDHMEVELETETIPPEHS